LQHLPLGPYVLESSFSGRQFVSASWFPHSSSNSTTVAEGTCREQPVFLQHYDFSGRVPAGLGEAVTVRLVSADTNQNEIPSYSIEQDGAFYFSNVPDGRYLLALTSSITGNPATFYYPGTYDRKKAVRISVANHALVVGGELDFNPNTFPLVPIPVAVDQALNFRKFSWDVQLVNGGYVENSHRWQPGEKIAHVYASRGTKYKILLYGSPYQSTADSSCSAEPTEVTAQAGMDVVQIKVPASCQ
jgi:hypothetical protein